MKSSIRLQHNAHSTKAKRVHIFPLFCFLFFFSWCSSLFSRYLLPIFIPIFLSISSLLFTHCSSVLCSFFLVCSLSSSMSFSLFPSRVSFLCYPFPQMCSLYFLTSVFLFPPTSRTNETRSAATKTSARLQESIMWKQVKMNLTARIPGEKKHQKRKGCRADLPMPWIVWWILFSPLLPLLKTPIACDCKIVTWPLGYEHMKWLGTTPGAREINWIDKSQHH